VGIDADTLYGTLNLLVLQALRDGPLHGLGVIRRIEAETRGTLRIEEGALYPALHRLERDGLAEGKWGRTEENRRARFYRLTRKGRRQLDRDAARWARHAGAVAMLLRLSPGWSE
jgi:PadR family transcriptional regulator PadR